MLPPSSQSVCLSLPCASNGLIVCNCSKWQRRGVCRLIRHASDLVRRRAEHGQKTQEMGLNSACRGLRNCVRSDPGDVGRYGLSSLFRDLSRDI